MFSNRILRLLVHPFFIGALITAAIFLFIPPVWDQYRIRQAGSEYVLGNDLYYYEDIDFDHNSEKIQFDLNKPEIIKILLYEGSQTVSQHNIYGQPLWERFFYFGDFDRDQVKDLFILTHRNDSVFLSVLDLQSDHPFKLKDRFIEWLRPVNAGKEIPVTRPVGLFDYDKDGYGEFVFSLVTGFSVQPRNIYAYNIRKDSLLKSPGSGTSLMNPRFFDLDRDSMPEVVCESFAPGNTDSLFPYSDQYGWLMVFDHTLGFAFHPVKFDQYPCRLSVVPLEMPGGNRLAVMHDYFGNQSIVSTLGIYDENGRRLKEKKLYEYERTYAAILPCQKHKNMFYLVRDRRCHIELMDTSLQVSKAIKGPEIYDVRPVASVDADGDGTTENIFLGNESGLFYVARNDFSSFTAYHCKHDVYIRLPFASVMVKDDNRPVLHLPFSNDNVLLEYSRNPWYKLRFIFIALAYLTISGFIYLIFLLQRYRARLHYENTRKMTELQMRSIRNQIDPHFTFNILNAIGSLYTVSENREKADYLFGKYARLLRQTVLASDQAEVTLEKELEFVKNYLDLERFRLNNKFDYAVETVGGADMTLKIPRLLIHTFAENAVKYAFMPKEGNGRLTIAVARENGSHCITITDNGPGLHSARMNETAGTGKGLEIVNEMIALYYSLTKVKIQYHLDELSEHGICTGTRARIIIMHA